MSIGLLIYVFAIYMCVIIWMYVYNVYVYINMFVNLYVYEYLLVDLCLSTNKLNDLFVCNA